MTKQQQVLVAVGGLAVLALLWKRQPVGTVTTSEGFDLSPYGGPTVYPEPIKQMAQAIARAEGFYVQGSIPNRAHNPGDLKIPGWDGPTLGNGISVFVSDGAGFDALYRQLWAIVTGQSNYYNLDMTVADMGKVWTATQQDAWSRNVAEYLSVPTSTPLYQVLV